MTDRRPDDRGSIPRREMHIFFVHHVENGSPFFIKTTSTIGINASNITLKRLYLLHHRAFPAWRSSSNKTSLMNITLASRQTVLAQSHNRQGHLTSLPPTSRYDDTWRMCLLYSSIRVKRAHETEASRRWWDATHHLDSNALPFGYLQ